MGSTPASGFRYIIRVAILVGSIAIALLGIASIAAPSSTGSRPVIESQEWHVLIDRAGLLDDGQRASALGDANRLIALGIPTQVVIEPTGFDQDQAEVRANGLRASNGVESFPGADDGLVIYASVSRSGVRNVVVAISTGANLLPNGGLTQGDMDTIRETIVQPQLADGQPARAIVYSMREMLYQQTFTPPPTLSIDENWRDIRQPFQVGSVVLAAAAATACVWSVRRGGGWLVLALAALAAIGMFAIAILTQSGLAVASSLALIATVAGCAWIRDHEPGGSGTVRTVRATPRPPGRFRATSR